MNANASFDPLPRVSTGIQGLDEISGGGLLRGGVYIVQGAPGAGKTILANQMSYHHASQGRNVVYVTMLAESHARLMQHMRELSFFDESRVPSHVYYISAFSALRTGGLRAVVELLRGEMRSRSADVLVLDGLVIAANAAPSDEELKIFVSEIQSHSTLTGCTTLLLTSEHADRPVSAEHTMVDGILLLRERAYGPRRERNIEIVKFRGSGTLRGNHSFAIGRDGIRVRPRLEAALQNSPGASIGLRGVTTGVPELDAMTELQGLPEGSVTAVCGYSGSGKTTLALHFVSCASPEEPALYFGFYESPEFLVQIAQRFGKRLQPLVDAGVLHFEWQLFGEHMLDDLAWRLLDAIRRTGARRVVVDGIGGFVVTPAYEERDGSFLAAFANSLRLSGATSLVTLEQRALGGDSVPLSTPTMSALADNVIHLAVGTHEAVERKLWLGKLRNSAHDHSVRAAALTPEGLRLSLSGVKRPRDA